MREVKISIDCEDTVCWNCVYSAKSEQTKKCGLFDVTIDHVVDSDNKKSGWLRCNECIKAEVKP